MTRELRIAGAVVVAVALTGCNAFNQFLGREDAIDYQSATPTRGSLSVPPDLTQVPANTRYQVPQGPGGTSFSQYATDQAQRRADAGTAQGSAVLPQRSDITVERDGTTRWLSVNMPANQVFERALEFWRSQGFAIRSQNGQAGLIETDWAENRANIPQDIIRRTVGRVFDQVWDSGQRELFRTRLERAPDGRIEVYFSHQHMVEEVINESQTKWVPRPSNPELDAAMLSRFMVFLGAEEERAKAEMQVAAAAGQPQGMAQSAQAVRSGSTLDIPEGFDRAWRRVGLALDRGNFTVEDRDRAAGQYYVRYVDVDAQQTEKPGFFSRMFGSRQPAQQPQYRVQLSDVGGTTRVTVLNADGQPDSSATAGRILEVLQQQLRD
ncbi:outer membrane protein assembly factor BamC [Achromobacter sp. GG226]|uniref:outer membrane protein assembly factor BamC n=1 Tax=Verticiella alkaliphila TaxID=2779529 RepID=UPI001C0D31FB|nr:outer membrane protein assembly factor BamC [Verticiella sp. GG226]MBU4611517.1 outer membrane protein assembly factor BamC [Verticiella sp. GG226]